MKQFFWALRRLFLEPLLVVFSTPCRFDLTQDGGWGVAPIVCTATTSLEPSILSWSSRMCLCVEVAVTLAPGSHSSTLLSKWLLRLSLFSRILLTRSR